MSLLGLILVAQAAAPVAASAAPPDIEIRAHVDLRSVKIRTQGRAQLTVHAEPGAAPPVVVERSAPSGRSSYRNLSVDLHGIARLSPPAPIAAIEPQPQGTQQ